MKNLPTIAIVIIGIAALFMGCGWLFNHSGFPFLAIIAVIILLAILFSKPGIKYFKKLFKQKITK